MLGHAATENASCHILLEREYGTLCLSGAKQKLHQGPRGGAGPEKTHARGCLRVIAAVGVRGWDESIECMRLSTYRTAGLMHTRRCIMLSYFGLVSVAHTSFVSESSLEGRWSSSNSNITPSVPSPTPICNSFVRGQRGMAPKKSRRQIEFFVVL